MFRHPIRLRPIGELHPTPLFQWDAMKHHQALAYTNGVALQRHIDNAHHGVCVDDCPACREIKARELVCKK